MKLSDYLAERDISVPEFARLIGVHRATVNRWLEPVADGETIARPSWDQIVKVYQVTGGLVAANDWMFPDVQQDTPASRVA